MPDKILAIGNKAFVDDIYGALSPLGVNIVNEISEEKIKARCGDRGIGAAVFDDDRYRLKNKNSRLKILKTLKDSKKDFIVVSSAASPSAVTDAKNLGASDYIIKPYSCREFLARFNAAVRKKTKITCIGGGTGLFHVLLALNKEPSVLLTSVVSTSDDGGSSGRLRATFGVLPPGDVRRSLVALSNAPEVMNEVMRHRFQKGEGLNGHNFGNLFLTALAEVKGSLSEAVRTLSDVLNIQGIVLPIADAQTVLCARFENDAVIKGESKIDLGEGRDPDLHIREIWHEPETECNINAFASIVNSDVVIIGPGDLFTSVATNLLVKNVREALSQTKAKKIYVCNLMTKPGETARYTAFDHVKEIVKYMGGDYLDYVIISNTKFSDKAVGEYAEKRQSPVAWGDAGKIRSATKAKVILADVGHETELVRHDSAKLRTEISKLLKQ